MSTDFVFPVREPWRLATGFDEARPLSKPPEERDHPHGAWDVGAKTGSVLYAPEDGFLYYWFAVRPVEGFAWSFQWPEDGREFAFRNYFYDTYGALVIILGESGLTHVFAHSFFNGVFNKSLVGKSAFDYKEEAAKTRYPAFAIHTLANTKHVLAGDAVGTVGDAGFSSGPHLHYEIHHGRLWTPWKDRPRQETLFPAEWERHKNDLEA